MISVTDKRSSEGRAYYNCKCKYCGYEIESNCVYRYGCPEFSMCKERFWANFLKWCNDNNKPLSTIQLRYDAYNEFFKIKDVYIKENINE